MSGMGRGIALEYGLTYDDGSRIQSTIPGVVRILPVRIIRENVRFARNSMPCQIIGTLPTITKSSASIFCAGGSSRKRTRSTMTMSVF